MDNLAYNLDCFTVEKSGVTRLTLTDFRNYQFLRINTGTESVVITGDNGAGKTNILEAISFLTPGRGLRSARLADIKRIDIKKIMILILASVGLLQPKLLKEMIVLTSPPRLSRA